MARSSSKSPEPVAAPEASGPAPAYTVLARRYRPQTFADLVGQEPVARALGNALKGNRVAHAYLFTGARGVGKTSTARILAKALNCVHGPTPTPCGECDICRSIATGEDVDVLEIDGASNNGVDDVRDLRGNVQYSPARARYKIYIIDEVHMLSKGAFNALLKTLEEPPPHVKFIFATTEVDKVPITILSRCQRFDFAGIPLPRIVERLASIVEQEKVKADPEALELIARRAGGSMRDAQSLLDQLLAFGGDRLTADQVHHLLGTAGDERILGLAEAVLGCDAKKALDLLDEAVATGLQLGELLDQLLGYWRDLMVVQCGGTEGRDFSVPARHHDTLRKHGKMATLDAVLAGLDVLATTKARFRGSNHARTLLEMAIVRLTRLNDLASLTQMAQWLGQARSDPRAAAPAPAGAPPALGVPRLAPELVKKKPLMEGAEPAAGSPGELLALSEETWPHYWPQIVSSVGAMLSAELAKAGTPAISGPNSLVFRFPSAYNQARDYVQSPERLRRLEEALARVTGKTWTVRIERAASPEAPAVGPPANGPAPSRAKQPPKEEAKKVALVKRIVDVLGATIQTVDEGFGDASNGRAPEGSRQTGGEEA
jgi:DNA polymerase-3 subunit gamma/tau